jgi:hypothetical protein
LISQKASLWLLLILAFVVALGVFFVPRIPQPQAYHRFGDARSFLGIPNFGDVVSNLPFAVIGLWGIAFILGAGSDPRAGHFADPRERWPYLFVFVGMLLTAFGSAYYHLQPNNARLVWDRLPIMMAFMSLVAAVITERVSLRIGLWSLPLLLAVGMGSVLLWRSSEMRGAGDLRLYAAVQVYSVLVLLVSFIFPQHFTPAADLAVVVGFYVLAKILETFDRKIFAAEHLISGHTLKHLAAAVAGYWILRMLQKRQVILDPTQVA